MHGTLFGAVDASSELYHMEQFSDYKILKTLSVVEQTYDIDFFFFFRNGGYTPSLCIQRMHTAVSIY